MLAIPGPPCSSPSLLAPSPPCTASTVPAVTMPLLLSHSQWSELHEGKSQDLVPLPEPSGAQPLDMSYNCSSPLPLSHHPALMGFSPGGCVVPWMGAWWVLTPTFFLFDVILFCQVAEFCGFINTNTMCTQSVHSFSSLPSLALGLGLLPTVAMRSFEEVRCAVSAQRECGPAAHFKLLMRWTRNFRKPRGNMCFVFLWLPQSSLGMEIWPLHLLCLLSVPLGFHQFGLILTYRYDWCRWTSWSFFFF